MSGTALLAVGVVAPDFTAAGSDGLTYTLYELLDHVDVVLFFYPGNNTPG